MVASSIPCRGPAGDRYSGEPHVFVSADTRQKSSFVNSLRAKRKTFRKIFNIQYSIRKAFPYDSRTSNPEQRTLSMGLLPSSSQALHLYERTKILNYAKQTQFPSFLRQKQLLGRKSNPIFHVFLLTHPACPEQSRRACPEQSRRACPEQSRRACPGQAPPKPDPAVFPPPQIPISFNFLPFFALFCIFLSPSENF